MSKETSLHEVWITEKVRHVVYVDASSREQAERLALSKYGKTTVFDRGEVKVIKVFKGPDDLFGYE